MPSDLPHRIEGVEQLEQLLSEPTVAAIHASSSRQATYCCWGSREKWGPRLPGWSVARPICLATHDASSVSAGFQRPEAKPP